MGNFSIIIFGFLNLFLELFFKLCSIGNFLVIVAIVDDFLHTGNLFFIHTLNTMQVLNSNITNGVCVPAVHINKSLKPILLTTVKKPVNRTLLIGLNMVFDKICQEIISDYFTACLTFIAQSIRNKIKIFFKRIFSIYLFQPSTKQTDNIIFKIFLVRNRNTVILIRNKSIIFAVIPFSTCISKSIFIKRITGPMSRFSTS